MMRRKTSFWHSLADQSQQALLVVARGVLLQHSQSRRSTTSIGVQRVNKNEVLTATSVARALLYIFWYSCLMLARSMSHRETMIRMRARSLVPMPLMALCKRSARYAGRLLAHLTARPAQTRQVDPRQSNGTRSSKNNQSAGRLTNGEQALLGVGRELGLDGRLERLARHGLVVVYDLAQVGPAARHQDAVEGALVRSEFTSTCQPESSEPCRFYFPFLAQIRDLNLHKNPCFNSYRLRIGALRLRRLFSGQLRGSHHAGPGSERIDVISRLVMNSSFPYLT